MPTSHPSPRSWRRLRSSSSARPVVTSMPEPWLIHFLQRHNDDDPAHPVPTVDFLDGLPDKIAAEIQAVLEAVAAAPPPAFSGGGKWEAMHDDMAGFYEVRFQGGGANHRLFCLLDRNADDLGGPSLICLGGPNQTGALRGQPTRLPPRQAVRRRVPEAPDCLRSAGALIVTSIDMTPARVITVDSVGLAGPAPSIRRTTSGRMPACRASSAFDSPRSLRRSSSARTTPSTAAMRVRAASTACRYSGLRVARSSK